MDTSGYHPWREPVKTCFLPTCPHDDVKNPDMRFFSIRKELKENWCQLVGRNCPKRSLFCCEDHLNLEESLENYEKWISGARPRLKLSATLQNIPEKTMTVRGKTLSVKDNVLSGCTSSSIADCAPSSSSRADVQTSNISILAHAAVQCESVELKSKSVMVKPTTKDQSTNFRARSTKKVMPSLMSHLPDSEESPCQSASLFGSSNIESTTSSTLQCEQKLGREHRMKLIKNKPKMYIGLPKNFWWLINFIAQQYSCLALHIIVTLFKIKNNDSFIRMSEEFEMARSTIRLLFGKTVILLATYFQNFIYMPSPLDIKKNLPLAFKIRYSNVQCIIDCFEIQIEKPTDPIRQAQTWSQYKSCNTVKYLIGCTPAGFITFISNGYGGRISDKAITDKSGFIDILPLNAVIMADRGFKEIEALLSIKNIKLLRPPSVFQNKNLTKREVIETKVIASLRVHIERVIRRVREFHMLKPHSVVNNKHVKYLDEIVKIACGLINLQESIIKEN